MELYVSGAEVPKLGSFKDKIARQYLSRKSEVEVSKYKLLALSAIASAGPNNQDWTRTVSSAFSNYSNLEFYLEDEIKRREVDMRFEFEQWRNVRPSIVKDKDGNLSIKGIS